MQVEEFSKKLKKEDKEKYKNEFEVSNKIVKKFDFIVVFYIGKEDK